MSDSHKLTDNTMQSFIQTKLPLKIECQSEISVRILKIILFNDCAGPKIELFVELDY